MSASIVLKYMRPRMIVVCILSFIIMSLINGTFKQLEDIDDYYLIKKENSACSYTFNTTIIPAYKYVCVGVERHEFNSDIYAVPVLIYLISISLFLWTSCYCGCCACCDRNVAPDIVNEDHVQLTNSN